MDRLFNRRQYNSKTLLSFNHIEKPVQKHLKNVYSTLCIGLLAAALGGYIHIYTSLMKAGFLTLIGSIGFMLAIMFTEHRPSTIPKRLGFFIGMATCTGLGLGPLAEAVMQIDPSIVPTAFLGTSVIFACFTLSALTTRDRSYLYLGGILLSTLSVLMLTSIINIFVRSQFLFTAELYIGLAVFCAFILYDTQLVIEKRRLGDEDFVWHAVDLFVDFIEVFRHLMIILGRKSEKRRDD